MNLFARNLLWVFRVNKCGGPEKVVETAKKLGAGLIIKYHDGDPSDDSKYGFLEQFRACLNLGQQQGVPIFSWGFCYGDTYGNLLKEADAAAQSLKEGAMGYVIDAEGEWEVIDKNTKKPLGPDWAKRFLDRVYTQVSDARERLAYAPFWNMRWHGNYPAAEFSKGCCAVMPQVYYALARKKPDQISLMWDITKTDFQPYGLPIYPIGEFSGATVQQVQAFLDAIGDLPRSWWVLDVASTELLKTAFPEPQFIPIEEYKKVVNELNILREKLTKVKEIVG